MTSSIRSAHPAVGALFSVLAAVFVPQAAAAQVDVPPVEVSQAGQPATSFTLGYQHQVRTNLEANGGQFSRDSMLVRGIHRVEVAEDWSLTTQFTYQGAWYDIGGWDPDAAVIGDNYSWGQIHQATFTGIVGWQADEEWELLAALVGRTSGEWGASFHKTLTGGGGAGFLYKPSADFQVGAIVGLLSQLGGNGQILPLPMLDWKMSEDWKLHLGVIALDAIGYGAELTYTPREEISLGVGGSYETRRFRLVDTDSDVDPALDYRARIGEESSYPIFARLGWTPIENLDLSLIGGVALSGQVRIGRESGKKLPKGQEQFDPAPTFGLQAQYRF